MLTREDASCHTPRFEVLKELETGLSTSLDPRSKGRRRARLQCRRSQADLNVAFGPKADIRSCAAHVRFRSKADIRQN